jgi:hypothetical protein
MQLCNILFRSKNYKPLCTLFWQEVSNQYGHLQANSVIFMRSTTNSCVESYQQPSPKFYILTNSCRCVRLVITKTEMVEVRLKIDSCVTLLYFGVAEQYAVWCPWWCFGLWPLIRFRNFTANVYNICLDARFQTSDSMQTRSALFWAVTQCGMVIPYRRFGTVFLGFLSLEGGAERFCRNVIMDLALYAA